MSGIARSLIILPVAVLATLLVFPAAAAAGSRQVVTPFDGTVMPEQSARPASGVVGSQSVALTPEELLPILQAGADHIVAQQCSDGGFGWPHDDCSATYHNITAPILLGVLHAYASTRDANHLAAAGAGGDFDLGSQWDNGEPRFGVQTPYFFMQLSAASGDPTYADHAAQEFFDALTAGTYGPDDWDTAAFIANVFAYRTGTWVNLRPWEFCYLVQAARILGNPGQADAFVQAALDGLASLDNTAPDTVYSDIIGLAGGIMALAQGGRTSFPAISAPLHAGVNGIDSLEGLVNLLLSYQNPDGSWNWHSNLPAPAVGDEDAQTTAYAVIALTLADPLVPSSLGEFVSPARDWLAAQQLPDGGFLSYPGGDENTEVEGEILTALAVSAGYDALPIPALGRAGGLLLVLLLLGTGLLVLRRGMA